MAHRSSAGLVATSRCDKCSEAAALFVKLHLERTEGEREQAEDDSRDLRLEVVVVETAADLGGAEAVPSLLGRGGKEDPEEATALS